MATSADEPANPRASKSTPAEVRRLAHDYLSKDTEQRIRYIRKGLPAQTAVRFVSSLELSKKYLWKMIGLSRSTIDRKLSNGIRLSSNESESVLAVVQLVAQAQRIVEESGNPDGFNASTWVSEWLSRPHAALGGKSPGDYMDTAEGRGLVGDLLLRQQSAAYS